MPATVDKKRRYNTIEKTCYNANFIYLVLHVFYLILFIVCKYYILVYVTAAVVAIYISFFFLIKKKKYYLYALLCGNEFFVYIAVTTIMLGFSTGFHFYLIGLCVVSFFTSYFSKTRNIRGSIVWVGLSLAIYLTLYFVTEFNTPHYLIDKWLEVTLFTTHAIIVFGFIAAYLVVFLKYAMGLEKKITNESRTDELTQISNRYALFDYFEQDADKYSKVLALFDIDDFKNINDKYGHVTGDYILKRVAEIATESLEDSFICRYGGEEFVVVVNTEHEVSYFERLENFRKRIEKEVFSFEGSEIKITITIGAVQYVDDIALEQWIEMADKKMYFGKRTGKNRVVV